MMEANERVKEAEAIIDLLKSTLASTQASVEKTKQLTIRLRNDAQQAKSSLDFMSREFFALSDVNASLLQSNAELHREILKLALERHGMTEIKDHLDSLEDRLLTQESRFKQIN